MLPPATDGRRLWLRFAGTNYRARISLDGALLADEHRIPGTFVGHELDLTGAVDGRATHVLAVEVFAPHLDDLAITWVVWLNGSGAMDAQQCLAVDLLASV